MEFAQRLDRASIQLDPEPPCAYGLSLVTAQRVATRNNASASPSTSRSLRFGRGTCDGNGSATAGLGMAAVFAGRLTGFPHFKQNRAPSGRIAPHLLQARSTVVAGGSAAVVGHAVPTGCPHFRQNCEPSGRLAAHLVHDTAGSSPCGLVHPSRTADISTGMGAAIPRSPRCRPSRVPWRLASWLRCKMRCAHPSQRQVQPRP